MRVVSVKSVVGALALVLVAGGAGLSAQAGRSSNGDASKRAVARFGGPQVQTASADEIEGVLEVTVEDHSDNKTVFHHVLNTANGKIRLREAPGRSDLAGLTTGAHVRVRGQRLQDGTLELQSAGTSGSTTSVTTMGLASPNMSRTKRCLPAAPVSTKFGRLPRNCRRCFPGMGWQWSKSAMTKGNRPRKFYPPPASPPN